MTVFDRATERRGDAMGAKVSIGDFAVMTSLSRKALRHYHDIGILEPAHVDPYTGYRFYDTSQVDHAHIIRRFRSLGMSIPDIKALLSTDDAAARAEIITTHLEQMEVQLQQTRDTVGALRELLSPVRAAAHVDIRREPPLAVWSVSATIETAEIDTWFGVALEDCATWSPRRQAWTARLCRVGSTIERCSSKIVAMQRYSSQRRNPRIRRRASAPKSCLRPSTQFSPIPAHTTKASTAVTGPWGPTSTSA